jgi:hypothetical protein
LVDRVDYLIRRAIIAYWLAPAASLGGTQPSQTAQPGITAATTALAVEHNSRFAAALAVFSRDPQLYLAGFDR